MNAIKNLNFDLIINLIEGSIIDADVDVMIAINKT